MFVLRRSGFLLSECLLDVLNEVVDAFHPDRQAYCRVKHVHLSALFVAERAEYCACRMYGECAVVEEVGGAAYELQTVDEAEAGLL